MRAAAALLPCAVTASKACCDNSFASGGEATLFPRQIVAVGFAGGERRGYFASCFGKLASQSLQFCNALLQSFVAFASVCARFESTGGTCHCFVGTAIGVVLAQALR